MSAEQNIGTVKAAYEAFGRQDIPAVLAAFDPNIEWYTPDELPFGGLVHGHDGVVGFFQKLPTVFDELRVEPDTFIGLGDHVAAVGHHRGKIKGEPFEIGFTMVWTLSNGKATNFREYNDSGKLLRLLEAQPALS